MIVFSISWGGGKKNQAFDIFGFKKPKQGQDVMALKRQNRAMADNLTHPVLTNKSGNINIISSPPMIKPILALTDALRYLDLSDLNVSALCIQCSS